MNVMARFLVGVSIGVATAGGCYAFAATAATHLATTFAPHLDAPPMRISKFSLHPL
jgi:hypothetical protein